MTEIWKVICGYEECYEVSNKGRVRNIKSDKVLKNDNNRGYKRIGLYKNGKKKKFSIHRLVAQAFIPNNNKKPYVNHKDENKTNNNVENLEWVTAKENNNYGTRTKRTQKPIIVIYRDNTYEEYPSATIAARELGLIRQNINAILNGRQKTHHNLRFEYVEGK